MSGDRPSVLRRVLCLWPLLYLAMLVFQPLSDPATGPFEWSVAAAAVLVFVPIYVVAENRDGIVRRWAPAISTLIGVLAFPVNSYAGVFFIYAAAFAGNHLSRRASTRWLIGLTALLGVIAVVSPLPFPWRLLAFLPSLCFVWIIGLACIEGADRRRAADALRVEHARIGHLATLTERERISRDLHDLLGQTLTGIVVHSQLAQRLTRTDPAAGAAEMAQVEQAARAALSEVRATVAGWRHVALDEEIAVSRNALAAAGVELVVTRDPELALTPSAETALSLALREAVTNVVRHAHAGRCTVALRRVDDNVLLVVTDDGVGGEAREGTGLTGMRERIAALGGDVHRAAGGGTALTVAVPAAVAT
jgi:two-component system, NarL family, sensor histidine kinase DesK